MELPRAPIILALAFAIQTAQNLPASTTESGDEIAARGRVIRGTNQRIEDAVRARSSGDEARAGKLFGEAAADPERLGGRHRLPLLGERLERARSWTPDEARRAADLWSRLEAIERDPVRADPEAIDSLLQACRDLQDSWCEARALLARAESFTEAAIPRQVKDDSAAAERILRQAGPSPELARALLLRRASGIEGDLAARASGGLKRYAEALAIARALNEPSIEGRLLCESVRIHNATGRYDLAGEALEEALAVAERSGDPRAAGCSAYFKGLRLYYSGKPVEARAAWSAFAELETAGKAPRELIWHLVGIAAASIDLAEARAALPAARRAVALAERIQGDQDRMPAYCNLATALLFVGRRSEMSSPAGTCLELARSTGRKNAEAVALARLAQVADSEGRLSDALDLYHRSLEISRAIGDDRQTAWTLMDLGTRQVDMGEVETGRKSLEEARRIADRIGWGLQKASIYATLSWALILSGEADAAQSLAQESLELVGPEGSELVRAYGLRTRGLINFILQDYSGALSDLRDSLALFERLGNREGQARALYEIGNTYLYLNRLDVAQRYYADALARARDAGSFQLESFARGALGILKRRTGTSAEDVEDLERFIDEAAGRLGRPALVNSILNLAGALQNRGELARAEEELARARELSRPLSYPWMDARISSRRSAVLHAQGRIPEAVAECRRALAGEISGMPDLRMRIAHRCSGIFREAGDAAYSLELAEEAVRIVEDARARIPQPGLRAAFLSDRPGFYVQLVSAIEANEATLGRAEVVARSFSLSERYRSRMLLEAISGSSLDLAGEDSRRSSGSAQRRDLLATMARLHMDSSIDESGRLERIREIERRLASLQSESPGDEAVPLLGVDPISLPAAQQLIPGDTAVLEYLAAERFGFVFAVTREGAAMAPLAGLGELGEQIGLYRGLLERRGSDPGRDEIAIRKLGERLHAALVKPVERILGPSIKRLHVVPMGPIQHLPFETLVIPEAGDGKPRFLIESYEVSRLPSLSVLAALKRHPARPPERGITLRAFANPVSPGRRAGSNPLTSPETRSVLNDDLPPLPYSEEEILRASRRIGGERILSVGSEATEGRVRAALEGGAAIVHVASHGFLDPGSEGRSGLVLSPGGTEDDGLLQSREVVDLRVDADLIVLSGCSTGGGKLLVGEGLMGLPHALFQAGARSIVMSLWAVRDRASALLMDRFYEGLAGGRRPAAALREAKLGMIRSGDAELSHPSVWAPFVFAGIGDEVIPLPPPGKGIPWLLPISLIALMAAAGLGWLGVRAGRRSP